MSPEEMRQLYDYNLWANQRSLADVEKLTSEQFLKPMGSSFPSVRDTLTHIYDVECLWLERFRGVSPSALPKVDRFADLSSLRHEWSQHDVKLLGFVRGLSQSDLDREMEYSTLKYGRYHNPLWQSMMHLINHGTYHRGQVTTLLRQHGVKPTLLDLIHYYRERATAPQNS